MLSATALVVGSYAMLIGVLSGGLWIGLVASVLSLYGGANVLDKHVTKDK